MQFTIKKTVNGNATTRIYHITYRIDNFIQEAHEYTYDANHNIINITVKNATNQTIESYQYQYDGFNQLIRENIKVGTSPTVILYSRTKTYTYNNQSNITSIKEYEHTVGDTSSLTPLIQKDFTYRTGWKDRIHKITYSGSEVSETYIQTYHYDNSGNVTLIEDSRAPQYNHYFEWDGRGLVFQEGYDGRSTYKYNDAGIRVYKQNNMLTTIYITDGYLVLVETWGSNTIYYTYDMDNNLLSMNYNGNEYFYIKNLQGDVTQLVDVDGNIVVKYRYDAWGNTVYTEDTSSIGLANINPYRYRGYRYDSEWNLYYLQSRYYDPQIGRFINADSINYLDPSTHTGMNLYSYAGNNPVMNVDPTGKFILEAIVIIVLVSAVINDIYQISSGNVYFNSETGDIMNSSSIITTPGIMGYSLYLKYFSEHKEYFASSAGGIAAEWIAHNSAFYFFSVTNLVGFGASELEAARHANVGPSIYSEPRRHYRTAFLAIQAVSNPISFIYDAYKNGYFNPIIELIIPRGVIYD